MLKTLVQTFVQKPKQMYFEGEDRDEEILYIFRRASITNLSWIFSSVLLILAPLVFIPLFLSVNAVIGKLIGASTLALINGFWYLFTVGYIFERFLNWFFNVYIITNKRIIDVDFNHMLHRNVSEAPLRNVEDITHTISGSLQTIFNFGQVSIQTAAESRELEFEYVSNPAKIQDILSDLVSEVRGYYVD